MKNHGIIIALLALLVGCSKTPVPQVSEAEQVSRASVEPGLDPLERTWDLRLESGVSLTIRLREFEESEYILSYIENRDKSLKYIALNGKRAYGNYGFGLDETPQPNFRYAFSEAIISDSKGSVVLPAQAFEYLFDLNLHFSEIQIWLDPKCQKLLLTLPGSDAGAAYEADFEIDRKARRIKRVVSPAIDLPISEELIIDF
ncbi:hypothetical protein QM565_30430 [Geitlerinema splendidum]|nr:hypothetical protein [Geitlerinema splendidum]